MLSDRADGGEPFSLALPPAVLCALGDRFAGQAPPEPDLAPWHALQSWLELAGCGEVRIPFARQLALGANPHAVRLRRDFRAVLDLVRAHAMLHQAGRERDEKGNLLATIDDYRAVYKLVIDYVSEGMAIRKPDHPPDG